jgi:hypothetical protein
MMLGPLMGVQERVVLVLVLMLRAGVVVLMTLGIGSC